MEWQHNPRMGWNNNVYCECGQYYALVGYPTIVMRYGVWEKRFDLDRRVYYGECNSFEEGKAAIEQWFRVNGIGREEVALCDECWTRHLPGENDLCSK